MKEKPREKKIFYQVTYHIGYRFLFINFPIIHYNALQSYKKIPMSKTPSKDLIKSFKKVSDEESRCLGPDVSWQRRNMCRIY